MKIRLIAIIIVQFLCFCDVKSQVDSSEVAQHAIYLEAAGIGGWGSLNYERLLSHHQQWNLFGRIGISTFNVRDYDINFNPDIIIPLVLGTTYGSQHRAEFGVGQVISSTVIADPKSFEPTRESSLSANLTVGYRYQKKKGGFMCRITYSPILESYTLFKHWGGLSFGYAF